MTAFDGYHDTSKYFAETIFKMKVRLVNIGPTVGRAVDLKGIWPRRAPKARAVHAAGGLGAFFFAGGGLI